MGLSESRASGTRFPRVVVGPVTSMVLFDPALQIFHHGSIEGTWDGSYSVTVFTYRFMVLYRNVTSCSCCRERDR